MNRRHSSNASKDAYRNISSLAEEETGPLSSPAMELQIDSVATREKDKFKK